MGFQRQVQEIYILKSMKIQLNLSQDNQLYSFLKMYGILSIII